MGYYQWPVEIKNIEIDEVRRKERDGEEVKEREELLQRHWQAGR
jgi:hypothetical protein